MTVLHESPHDTDEPGVLCAFLQRYLADRTSGEPESLAAYQARYPGYEAAIAREFARLSAAAADGPEDRYEVQAELAPDT